MSKVKSPTHRKTEDQEIRDRALRIFTFLRELTELRSRTVRTIDQYEKVLWFNDIPRESGCHCVAWTSMEDEERSEVWAEIKKPRLKAPPQVEGALKPWLDPTEVEDSSREYPQLRKRITINVPDKPAENGGVELRTVFKDLGECPEIKAVWQRYIEQKWRPWAEEDRRLQTVQKVYTDLFSIYQKQQRLGEAYEVVLGLGYLTWRRPTGHEVKRHIITAQTSLTFDAARGVITLGPAGEGAKPTLEQDMLEPQERPDPALQNAIQRQVEEIGDDLWDAVKIQAALKGWVHASSPRGQFDETIVAQTTVGPDPTIHLAPAVILRKRTERSLLRVFQEIIEQLRGGKPVPVGVRRLVTIIDDLADISDQTVTEDPKSEAPGPLGEIHFPLPANDEQLEIVRKLSIRQGVLVQGPPGTGKSHTIANLVCHLLAMGQRVLVTSHTARALKVLRDKFPKEVAHLCVILLGDDLNAMQALEDSVRGITDRYNTWDRERNRQNIVKLERKLAEARKAEASTLSDLRAIREAETYRHPPRFGSYGGTGQAIATRLREEEPCYSWISVQPEEHNDQPLSDMEAMELVRLLREINTNQEQELTKRMIDPDSLIDPTDFVDLVRTEADIRGRHTAAENHRSHPSYIGVRHAKEKQSVVACPACGQVNRITEQIPNAAGRWVCGRCRSVLSSPSEQLGALIGSIAHLVNSYEALIRHVQPFVRDAATQILAGRDRAWRELLTVTRQYVDAIGDRARRSEELRISGVGERDRSMTKAHAQALLQHLEAGGGLGIWPFRPKVVKEAIYLIREVRVDGQLCNKPKPLRDLLERIEIADLLTALRRQWSRHIGPPSGSFTQQVAEYEDMCEPLEKALELHDQVGVINKMMPAVPGVSEPSWHDLGELRALREALEAVKLDEELAQAQSTFDHLERCLSAIESSVNAHPVVGQALQAVETRDERRYREAYQILCDLRKSHKDLQRRRDLLHRLEVAAPELATELASSYADPIWDARMAAFSTAWNWARADLWLKQLNDPHAQDRLSNDLDRHRIRIREHIRDLAAAKAWGHCFTRLTEHERQHLMAWTKAVRRVGKGTGKYAAMHRRAAREHMEQCRSAIPAWIMPIYRVAETVRPGTESFDVVIVDEASQSGPEALFLHYVAKKIVVVGDDKQISPDFVGLTREDVELLRQRHIRDLPHSDALGVDNSFFDQAEIRYGGRIRLREHFRCMPEIIQFSNNLCYQSEPLKPLRQYGAGRLTPVIVTRHVPDGYQRGQSPKVINPPEAESIVDQIRKCCEDPMYARKSIGVISLLGEDQARLIEKLLLEKIGPEEMEERHLVCGDAYAFQGDERDVMFLSLVAAPAEGRRIGTLASQRDERRFNVAASRARDQVWLFHTATLNDLSPNCLRYRLLQYCHNPQVQPTTLQGLDLEEIKTIARTTNRDRIKSPTPFESWFEVDVFLKIAERGYRVIPQFEVAGYRIDLLVEGMQGRLAVECDGDTWHGADRFETDTARQRMLERCNLTFWRVRGSTFYRDHEAALEALWNTLSRLGIHPTSQDMVNISLDVTALGHPVSPPQATEDEGKERGASAGKAMIHEEALSDPYRDKEGGDARRGSEGTSQISPLVDPGLDYQRAVLEALQTAGRPMGRLAIMLATAIPEEAWNRTIGLLKEKGLVSQEGDGRSAVYRLVSDT